jgi:hypothetical protein
VTAIGAVLISAAPARADHHHYGHHHHHGSDFGFFFGLPVPIPVVYEPRAYSAPPPASYDPAPQRPYFDEGHWRHEDGWDRRDEHGEWPHNRDRGDD